MVCMRFDVSCTLWWFVHNATYAMLRFCFRACSRLRSTNISTAASFACFDCASYIFSGFFARHSREYFFALRPFSILREGAMRMMIGMNKIMVATFLNFLELPWIFEISLKILEFPGHFLHFSRTCSIKIHGFHVSIIPLCFAFYPSFIARFTRTILYSDWLKHVKVVVYLWDALFLFTNTPVYFWIFGIFWPANGLGTLVSSSWRFQSFGGKSGNMEIFTFSKTSFFTSILILWTNFWSIKIFPGGFSNTDEKGKNHSN